jgi:ElaB/YqjD/DUF883 family membrane-anchored ribosome-binding protein
MAFRSTFGAASSLFAKSPAQEMADTAAKITDTVRSELFGSPQDFRGQLQNYINQLKPKELSPAQIGEAIARTLDETEIKSIVSPDWHENTMVFLQKEGRMSPEKAQAVTSGIKNAASVIRQEAGAKKDVTSKAVDTVARVAGVSSKDAEEYRHKVENYLRSTKKHELNPDGIRHDIEELLRSPKAGFESLKARASSIDKSTVTALLAQRKDMSPDEARKVVDRVDQVLREITGTVQEKAQAAQGTVQGHVQAAKSGAQSTQSGVLSKIRNYLDSMNRPELRYGGIKHDLQLLFHDPKAGADALIDRFKSMDRDTLKAIISSRRDMSEEDAEHLLQRIESTRDEYLEKAQRMKDEVALRVEDARREAMRQADETRKTAATAAWWIVGTAVVSGICAVLGGLAGVL